MRHRAAELGVSVSYWDWQGHEVIVPDETLAAIVTALEEVPLAAATRDRRRTRSRRCPSERSWGFTVQLYSLRSRGSWGHGDLRDLADFATWSARDLGAGFVLINPLHAAEPLPPVSPSPYLPMSRRWVSPLYLRIEDIPEYKDLSYPERMRLTALPQPLRAARRTPALIDRDAVWTAKREALEMLRKVPLSDERQASLDAFRARHGRALEDWAAWCALAEVHGPDYRTWPARLRDPRSAEAEVRGGDLAAQAEFHAWVQWLVAEQVAAAQAAARDGRHGDRHHRRPGDRRAPRRRGRVGRAGVPRHAGSPSARRRTRSTSAARTGRCRRIHPRALAAAGYRPLADCSLDRRAGGDARRWPNGCRGGRRGGRAADRPRHGAVAAVVDTGRDVADRGRVRVLRRARARWARSRRRRRRPGRS